jgi:fructose-1,6-bisphosphatase II
VRAWIVYDWANSAFATTIMAAICCQPFTDRWSPRTSPDTATGQQQLKERSMSELPEPNLALDLVRVTEAAALAAGRWMGRGNKIAADQAAVDAMRLVLNTIEMDGVIVIGEGEKDEAPMLFNGERLGTGKAPAVDIAVDPVEGTSLTARGSSGALCVAALAERGSMYAPGSLVYMDKIAVGPEARGVIDINAPVEANLKAIARAKGRDVDDLTVIILDRPRHAGLIDTVRQTGARIRLIHDGDVSGGVSTALDETGIDVLLGVGGSPEAVITAAALKCLGGEIQCKLWPRDDRERQYAAEHGLDLQAILTMDDLVKSDNVFFSATGITRGELLDGVRYFGGGARTSSVVMRSKSGTIRYVTATHRWDKLMRFSQIKFD